MVFLVKTNNLNICQLRTVDHPSEIIFYKDVRMNSNRITNLPATTLPHETVNKLHVDGTPRKIFHGYVPNLRSSGPRKTINSGLLLRRHPMLVAVFIQYTHLTVYTDPVPKVNGRQTVKL